MKPNEIDKTSAIMRKGDSKLLIRNLRKMKEQEEQKQALDLSSVIQWVETKEELPKRHTKVLLYDVESENYALEFIHDFDLETERYTRNWTHWAEFKPPVV